MKPLHCHSLLGLILLGGLLLAPIVWGQDPSAEEQAPLEPSVHDSSTPPLVAPKAVDVTPLANDQEISLRLTRILEATGWFTNPQVRVEEGVVFLRGSTTQEKYRAWAEQLAGNTQDVVAVVNNVQTVQRSMWDFTPAWNEVLGMGRDFVQSLPLLLLAIGLLVLTWYTASYAVIITRWLLGKRLTSELLRTVVSRAIAIPVFILGLYLILRVSGLTRLAMTVLGGTGLIGLVLGFAFRDIAENFLASILISMNNPFQAEDLIEVAGHKGFVQQVTTRGTILMTLDGNHVQIPNATIYKETIINYSANPNTRCNFGVGIGYDDSIAQAQQVALTVLSEHPAVVDDPEPMVLVESLGASTVNLRVFFWVNTAQYSPLKVPSAVIRLTKHAFEQAGISMPDESREVVFPMGVPITQFENLRASAATSNAPVLSANESNRSRPRLTEQDTQSSNSAEGGLESEVTEIAEQARKSRTPEAGANLLDNA